MVNHTPELEYRIHEPLVHLSPDGFRTEWRWIHNGEHGPWVGSHEAATAHWHRIHGKAA